MRNQLLLHFSIITCFQLLSCNPDDDKIMATIGSKKIYQSQIDSMISEEVESLRENALRVKISRTLFENEAGKRKITIDELRLLEIINRTKPISKNDIESYAQNQNIRISDSSNIDYIKTQLLMIYSQLRFETFIDSLKEASGVKTFYSFPKSKISKIDNLYSHTLGNRDSKTDFYIIADYDCPSCKAKYSEIMNFCFPFLSKIKLHFIYYSNHISEKAYLGEALAKQGKFWEVNQLLFNIEVINDSIINDLALQYNMDGTLIKKDIINKINNHLIIENQRLLEELMIYSVPTYIIDDEIIPEYYSMDKFLQIITYKISNN